MLQTNDDILVFDLAYPVSSAALIPIHCLWSFRLDFPALGQQQQSGERPVACFANTPHNLKADMPAAIFVKTGSEGCSCGNGL